MNARWQLLLLGLLIAVIAVSGSERKNPETPTTARLLPGPGMLIRSRELIEAEHVREEPGLDGAEGDEEPTAAGDLMKYRYLRKVNDQGVIPRNGLIEAKHYLEAAEGMQKDAGLSPNWAFFGPGNIGGRVRAACFDPTNSDHLFLGAAGGGIWESFDRGASWAPVNDFLANLAVNALAADSGGNGIFYAGTGEGVGYGTTDALRGAGFFRSLDGGNTWTQVASTTDGNYDFVSRIATHPTTPGHIYIATETGIYESTNFGLTFTQLLSTSWNNRAYDVDAIYAPASDELWLVAGTNQRLYMSTDGGATWVNRSTGNTGELWAAPTGTSSQRCEVTFAPRASNQDPYIYVSVDINGGMVARSTDGGTTWTTRSSSSVNYLAFGWYANSIWVEPGNANRVIVGGTDLYRSTDGGTTLTKMSKWQDYDDGLSAHADQHLILADPDYDSSTNPRIYFGNDGGLQKKDDAWTGGVSVGWTNLANGLGITQFFYGAAKGATLIGGAQDNSVVWRGGSNNNWIQKFTGDGSSVAVDPTNPMTLYACTNYLKIQKSTDAGNNWNVATNGLGDSGSKTLAPLIGRMVMDPNNSSTLIAGGSSIWRTTNGASNWTSILNARSPSTLCSAMDIAAGNSAVIWVGYRNGSVSRTTNNGATWNDVHNNGVGLPAGRWVSDIAINPTNSNDVIVVFAGFNTNNVWRTTDNGSNWEDISGIAPFDLPSLPVSAVSFHPSHPSWIYIGTDLGILATENGGNSWSRTPVYGSGNEGPVNTEVADLFWDGDYLYAATHGRGMWGSFVYPDVWVDLTNSGIETGTFAQPFNTVQEGVDFMGNGANLHIRTGNYVEAPLVFDRRGIVRAVNGTVIVR